MVRSRGRKIRVTEDVADFGGFAAREERGRGGRDLGQRGNGALPVRRDDLADGEALLGVPNRGGEELGPLLRPEPAAELVPAVDATRD